MRLEQRTLLMPEYHLRPQVTHRLGWRKFLLNLQKLNVSDKILLQVVLLNPHPDVGAKVAGALSGFAGWAFLVLKSGVRSCDGSLALAKGCWLSSVLFPLDPWKWESCLPLECLVDSLQQLVGLAEVLRGTKPLKQEISV